MAVPRAAAPYRQTDLCETHARELVRRDESDRPEAVRTRLTSQMPLRERELRGRHADILRPAHPPFAIRGSRNR